MKGVHASDLLFAGSIPEFYDRYMVPMLFEPYADDLVDRLKALGSRSILEVAAGTGVVTRAMARGLSDDAAITATDLSTEMLDYAATVGTTRPVTWRQADVVSLPVADASYDTVVCQFGVMFFDDRPSAFAEVARVLRPGGSFLFTTWDEVRANEFIDVVDRAVASMFPDDPPGFVAQTPHGYFDHAAIQADVAAGGFVTPAKIEEIEATSRAPAADIPAIAFCQGTPLRNAIEARDPSRVGECVAVATRALAERFGPVDLEGRTRGYVVAATRA